MGKMTVYHGSYTIVERPRIVIGKNTKDFGPGFYCTMLRDVVPAQGGQVQGVSFESREHSARML